jgi:hypothetical protein
MESNLKYTHESQKRKQRKEKEAKKRKGSKEKKRKEKEMEREIKRLTMNMTPIQAWKLRDDYLKNLSKDKEQPDLYNALTEKLLDVHLKDIQEDNDQRKPLKWKNFKKMRKKKGINYIKRSVNKWLGREKSDIRDKIDKERERIGGRANGLPNPVLGIVLV